MQRIPPGTQCVIAVTLSVPLVTLGLESSQVHPWGLCWVGRTADTVEL